jgi:hypothetical protein
LAGFLNLDLSEQSEVDRASLKSLRLVLIRASEAHLLAKEIADAGVGVILIPARQFPGTWDQLRALPGPPLTPESAIGVLLRHNVTLGLGITEEWEARNQRFDIGWVTYSPILFLDFYSQGICHRLRSKRMAHSARLMPYPLRRLISSHCST